MAEDDKCPKCGCPLTSQGTAWQIFACGAQRNLHSGYVLDHLGCVSNQLDRLRNHADALAEAAERICEYAADDDDCSLTTLWARAAEVKAALSAYRAAMKGEIDAQRD